ncbi:cytochrome P450 [Daedalea quercina L-15889]|uniref:Cytochrome P450 n=1 Tax=Daedalea quercina L-15889 TaxID=1314783 RepID=A0A165QEK2_9APHY|nr:cytochrome P450 [Daedalea quercina L-15889]
MTTEKAESSASSYSIALIVCLLVVRVLTVVRSYIGRYRLRLPPGPRRIPVLGNIHQLPPVYQQHLFAEWGKQFGDLVYARFFRTPVLILNRIHTARALLEKRGAKYSSRPSFTYQRDIVHFDHVIIMPYSDRWRRHRRWFQNALLTRNTLSTYEPMQRREVQTMLHDILHDSEGALAHIRRYTAAVMLGVGYGYSPTSLDDKYIKMTEEAIELALGGTGPSSGLVDFFPELQYLPAWMPGMGFKRKGLRARKMTHDMDHLPLQRLQREMEEGISRPCLGTALLEDAMNKGVLDETEEHEIAGALGVLYVGKRPLATAATLTAFVLLMALHQDIQKKMQAEIDSVVGDLRLPASTDRTSLPYFEAVLKEVYRWLAPAPLGTPHQVTESDVYEGFDIEKGATVITNIWAMTREEELFQDPERFDPERFLGTSAEISEARDPRRFVFGFGRRICPGRLIADSSVFLAAVNLVAAFDIRPGKGLDPQQAVAQSSFTSGIVRHPKPFPCYVTPRSPKNADLVLHAVDASGGEA